MKKILWVVLIVLLLVPAGLFAETGKEKSDETLSANESYNMGAADAREDHSAAGWAVAGVVSGGLFSLLGAGITVGIAAATSPDPEYLPDNVDLLNYQRGYEKAARKKNVAAALISGSIMSALWIIGAAATM